MGVEKFVDLKLKYVDLRLKFVDLLGAIWSAHELQPFCGRDSGCGCHNLSTHDHGELRVKDDQVSVLFRSTTHNKLHCLVKQIIKSLPFLHCGFPSEVTSCIPITLLLEYPNGSKLNNTRGAIDRTHLSHFSSVFNKGN